LIVRKAACRVLHIVTVSPDTSRLEPDVHAMTLIRRGEPLVLQERPDLVPGPGEVRLHTLACAVCRTDLHIVDGDLTLPRLPLVPGHEIVGRVDALGAGVRDLHLGQRVGVPWLAGTCGSCPHCAAQRENLCSSARFTGFSRDGGFATQVLADARYCFSLEGLDLSDVEAAPLLCAGLIGWRALKKAGNGPALGLYGFGASAHLIVQVAVAQKRRVYAFTRAGDRAAQAHALSLGAVWAGSSDETPPEVLDAAILFAPVGALVPTALAAVRPGGTVVCAGIHMSDIPSFPYALLWQERQLMSVANLTREDGREFLALAVGLPLQVRTTVYPLEQANDALQALRSGALQGAAVLVPD
jgi:propanol-preferring alcohol dehydrogenase